MGETKPIIYSSHLPLWRADEKGVWFGSLAPPGISGPEGKAWPSALVIPRRIWDINEKPEVMTVGFSFGEFSSINIWNDE